MNIKLQQEVSYAFEICYFLKIYSDKTYYEFWSRLLKRDEERNGPEFSRKLLDLYTKLSKHVTSDFTDISLLFETYEMDTEVYLDNTIFPANGILWAYEYSKYFKGRERKSLFLASIVDDENLPDLSFSEYMELLDKTKLSEKTKWLIVKIYSNYQEYEDKLLAFIDTLIPQAKQLYSMFNDELDNFNSYWSATIKDDKFFEEFKQISLVSITIDQLVVYPAILTFSSANISEFDMRIGIRINKDAMLHQNVMDDELTCEILKLLSDPSKFEILKMIKDQELYGQQIASALNLSTATISHHMSKLLNVRLLEVKTDNNKVYYKMNHERMAELIAKLKETFQ